MATADIGLIGLAVMGSNLALNIAEKGYMVAAHNRTASKIDDFVAMAKAQGLDGKIIPKADLADFIQTIKRPRSVIIMVKAGKPVDDMIEQLLPHLEKGDAILECGNSLYTDTNRRFDYLAGKGIGYLGIGVSGGEEGARHGPSIMVGGSKEQWHNAEPILTAIAAKFNGESCCAYLGEGGAGHFVKTIHNGIEYGDMQMIAEVYGVMRDGMGMNPAAGRGCVQGLEQGPAQLLPHRDRRPRARGQGPGDRRPAGRSHPRQGRPEGHRRLVRGRGADARRSGDGDRRRGGRALDSARARTSASRPRRSTASRRAARSTVSLDDLEKGLLAGKIVSYAQGFAVMAKASEENGWNLPLATIAKIWRAGCIIRSRFLDQMASAYAKGEATNLLMVPDFIEIMKTGHGSLRRVIAAGVTNENPDDLPLGRALVLRQLSAGPRHRQPHPGAARLLRRPRL